MMRGDQRIWNGNEDIIETDLDQKGSVVSVGDAPISTEGND